MGGTGDLEDRTVAITWNISIKAIAALRAPNQLPLEINLLAACAYMASEKIPRSLLHRWLQTIHSNPPLSSVQMTQCLGRLLAYSMIRPEGSDYVSMHRVVQAVIRHQQSGKMKEHLIPYPNLTVEWYNSLLIAAHNEFSLETQLLEDETREEQLHPHFQALVEQYETLKLPQNDSAFSRVLFDIAKVFLRRGNPHAAKSYYERALIIDERHYGVEHVEVTPTLNNLGNAYGDLADTKKQKELLEQALVIQERHYGAEHPVVAITLNNLGNAYGDLGDTRKKRELLERALVIEECHYGAEYHVVAITLANLGNTCEELGDTKKQKELLERALVIQERHYGAEHVQVTPILTSLSSAYGALRDTKKQKELLERALVIQGASLWCRARASDANTYQS